jgi:2,3-bisphosphoglycerate-independent phosphoglycerate mutase
MIDKTETITASSMENKSTMTSYRFLFIFLDGVGLAPPSELNPLSTAAMPFIRSLVGGPLVYGADVNRAEVLFRGIDATLGVGGTPQSATGQTSLFAGVNAAAILGFHLPAFPSERLIAIIREHSILKTAVALGKRATFANAYSSRYFDLVASGARTHSVTTHCVLAAGLPFRTMEDLREGRAVYWDLDNRHLTDRGETGIPVVTPRAAGERLAALCGSHDLVLFESFAPDLIGHEADPALAGEFLGALDVFLGGVVAALPEGVTLVLSSDHGNIEDLSTAAHTKNPVPLLCVGPGAGLFAEVKSIDGVTPSIVDGLRN